MTSLLNTFMKFGGLVAGNSIGVVCACACARALRIFFLKEIALVFIAVKEGMHYPETGQL